MTNPDNWLTQLLNRNKAFRAGARQESLPVARTPGQAMVITCMDPRVNPDALGIEPFGKQGEGPSSVRVIRTIGGMAEDRSLIVGIHLAGIREIAVIMHTDCGNCLAKQKIEKIATGLVETMPKEALASFKQQIPQTSWHDALIQYLKAFDDPAVAVRNEVAAIRARPFVPKSVVVHGLVYRLADASLELVVNGYNE